MMYFIATGLCLASFVAGVFYGHWSGVKETEVRWSEAVARADAHRNYERTKAGFLPD